MRSEHPFPARQALGLVARIALLTIVLIILQGVGSQFIPAPQPATQPTQESSPQPSAGFLAIVVTVALLQTIALAFPTLRSRWHGWRLTATICLVFFGTVTFMSQVESLIYLRSHLGPGMLRGIVLMGAFTALAFSPVLVLVLGRTKPDRDVSHEPANHVPGQWTTWAWKLPAAAAVFAALYYLFGYYVAWRNPAVRGYYGGTDPGSFLAQMRGIARNTPWMLPLQFVRGLLWVLLALPVIRMMKGQWWEAGLALSLLFGVPATYLLFPNPVMPEPVRMAHLIETAPYQFLFGWFVAWLWRGPRRG
jgi:hypothetical protein